MSACLLLALLEALPAGEVKGPGAVYLFQGARYDAETGFYYSRNRYYDPRNGRFLQRDPVWDAQHVGNQYTFAASRPASAGDPFGTDGSALNGFREWQAMKAGEGVLYAQSQIYRQLGLSHLEIAAWNAIRIMSNVWMEQTRQCMEDQAQVDAHGRMFGEGHWRFQLAERWARQRERSEQYMRLHELYIASWGPAGTTAVLVSAKPVPVQSMIRPVRSRIVPAPTDAANLRAYEDAMQARVRATRLQNLGRQKQGVMKKVNDSIARDIRRQRGDWESAVKQLRCQGVFSLQEASWILRNLESYIGAAMNRDIYLSNFGRVVLRPPSRLGIPAGKSPMEGSVSGSVEGMEAIPLDGPPQPPSPPGPSTGGRGTEVIPR